MPTAGYSGTPLAKKLGIKPGFTVAVINEPPEFRALLDPTPEDVVFRDSLRGSADVVVAFFTERSKLRARLPALARSIYPAAVLWLAWPKKTAGVPTDLDGGEIRGLGQAAGVVDVKVAAISETWSGHKFVHRVENRSPE
ncbi:MAG: DUF3052 domain-containing protein [Actinomycetota bacterium]